MALINIAGRPVHVSTDRPTIGKHYEPPQTLRSMPRHWHLDTDGRRRDRWPWWRDGDFWVGATCCAIVLFFGAQSVAELIK